MTAGPEEIAAAVARLRAGGVVAFPTETVYGLGGDAMSADAVGRVFALKGRPATNPLIVHVSGEPMGRELAATGAWSKDAAALARAFWPGSLTIVVAKAGLVPPIVTGGGATVGVRCPAHHATLAMIEGFGGPVVGPSANPSGRVSPTTAAHVRASFGERDVLVLDGGPCRGGIESTVVSLAGPAPRVLRPGPVSVEQIAGVLGRAVERPPAGEVAPADEAAASPGMQARHYAPRTRAVLFEPAEEARVLSRVLSGGGRIAVISGGVSGVPPPHVHLRMPLDADGYAARLYAALREADELGVDLIAVERPNESGTLWDAIRDRLSRAAAPAGQGTR
ncbi:MAG: L-threonylcarbamoyladenylate synthase [Phycisphaerales bacterium]